MRTEIWLIALSLILLQCAACSSYRVVRVLRLTDQDSGTSETFYGITKNNVLVPEYVLDRQNRYPTNQEDAWARFEERREKIDALVDKKYRIPGSFFFQTERFIVGLGLLLVSPVAIPIQYLGGLERDEAGKRSFSKTTASYFDLSINNVIEDEARVRDPLIPIQ